MMNKKTFLNQIKVLVIVISLILLLANYTVNPIIQVQNPGVKSEPGVHTQ